MKWFVPCELGKTVCGNKIPEMDKWHEDLRNDRQSADVDRSRCWDESGMVRLSRRIPGLLAVDEHGALVLDSYSPGKWNFENLILHISDTEFEERTIGTKKGRLLGMKFDGEKIIGHFVSKDYREHFYIPVDIKMSYQEISGPGQMLFYFGKEENTVADIEKKKFDSGIEKLEQEKKWCLATVNVTHKKIMEAQYNMLFSLIIDRCKADADFDAMVLQEHKTWGKCMKYCSDKVISVSNPTEEQKRKARSGEEPIAIPVSQEMMLGWIEEYYRCDDKAEEEAKAAALKNKKAQGKQAEKVSARKNEQAEESKETKEPVKEKKHEKKPAKKTKAKEEDGQMSLFDFMM